MIIRLALFDNDISVGASVMTCGDNGANDGFMSRDSVLSQSAANHFCGVACLLSMADVQSQMAKKTCMVSTLAIITYETCW